MSTYNCLREHNEQYGSHQPEYQLGDVVQFKEQDAKAEVIVYSNTTNEDIVTLLHHCKPTLNRLIVAEVVGVNWIGNSFDPDDESYCPQYEYRVWVSGQSWVVQEAVIRRFVQ